jgi:nicotinamide riboside transporter PnuC
MSRNRDLAAAFGVLWVAWASLAAMGNPRAFAEDIPVNLHFPFWVLAVLVLIFIPLIRGVARWTALGAGIVGIIVVIFDLVSLTIVPPAIAYGPIIGLIFAALFAFFAFRAYLEKPLA